MPADESSGDETRLMKKYLLAAYRCASRSPDPSTQNGAVIVDVRGELIAEACNTFPRGIRPEPGRLGRPEKYSYLEHAERNAIYAAARVGKGTDGATLYCPWFACTDCARAMIQAGIRRVVGHAICHTRSPDRWKESIELAFDLLREAGIEVVLLPDSLESGLVVRFNGRELSP